MRKPEIVSRGFRRVPWTLVLPLVMGAVSCGLLGFSIVDNRLVGFGIAMYCYALGAVVTLLTYRTIVLHYGTRDLDFEFSSVDEALAIGALKSEEGLEIIPVIDRVCIRGRMFVFWNSDHPELQALVIPISEQIREMRFRKERP